MPISVPRGALALLRPPKLRAPGRTSWMPKWWRKLGIELAGLVWSGTPIIEWNWEHLRNPMAECLKEIGTELEWCTTD